MSVTAELGPDTTAIEIHLPTHVYILTPPADGGWSVEVKEWFDEIEQPTRNGCREFVAGDVHHKVTVTVDRGKLARRNVG